MERAFAFIGSQLNRFIGWMFSTKEGWITFIVIALALAMKFQPELLSQAISSLIAGIIDLITRVIRANQKSLEYLFCIALSIAGIKMMLKGILGKKGGAIKK